MKRKKVNADPANALGDKTSWGDSIRVKEGGKDVKKSLGDEGDQREIHINV